MTTSAWVSVDLGVKWSHFIDSVPVSWMCRLTALVCLLDIDECGTELARCPSNTYCHNTDGSYECRGMLSCTGCLNLLIL